MPSAEIGWEGDKELLQALIKQSSPERLQKVVRKNGKYLQKKAIKNAIFNGHMKGKKLVKPTGATRQSIKLEFGQYGLAARVSAGTHYSGYLEVGTRFMEAQPFMQPALDVVMEQFLEDLAKDE
ncbi:hypothetical protein VMHJH2_09460 [Streptococcus uberis]|uniref:HK97-gp10 family putative phage morphogenesis protein n=1 Tax=Streptococcus uberis TaxID=1349 RepID=UPI0021501ED0|nr:HK97-gp10 family putative phage morphogenesis protein [Streptococcus uberis]MCR4258746.1 hypothetical protein [Streptococcus uberis]